GAAELSPPDPPPPQPRVRFSTPYGESGRPGAAPRGRVGSPTHDAVIPADGVGADAGDQSCVRDAGQLGAAGAGDVDGAEGSGGEDKAVLVAGGVGESADDVTGGV